MVAFLCLATPDFSVPARRRNEQSQEKDRQGCLVGTQRRLVGDSKVW